MSNKIDLEFDSGENWKIVFTAHNADGSIMPLVSGAVIEFRINGEDGTVMEKQSPGNGIYVTDDVGGVAEIAIPITEQDDSGIVAFGLYEYAIRVTIGVEVSIQAEGIFGVNRSVFSGMVDPLLAGFRKRFSEFKEDDGSISLAIADAALIVDADDSWRPEDRATAKIYLAAHLLQMGRISASRYESGGQNVGAVKTIRVEDRMISYDTQGSKTAQAVSSSGLAQTIYGQRYLSMLRRNVIVLRMM
jgi:hypothetical protein